MSEIFPGAQANKLKHFNIKQFHLNIDHLHSDKKLTGAEDTQK